jgi:glycosyltransferase involved in cell wall biosynthesis
MLKRKVFKNLKIFFNSNYTFLPKVFRILPAILFYFHYYLDILKINSIKSKLNLKSIVSEIKDDTEIVFFEDSQTHQHLIPFYQSFNKGEVHLFNASGETGYRSNFLDFVLSHNFRNSKIIHILTLEHLTYSKLSLLKKFKKLPQKKIATAHLFMPIDEVIFLSQFFDKLIVLSEFQHDYLMELGIKNVESILHPVTMGSIDVPDKKTLRKKYSIPDDTIVFSMLGSIRKDKGIHILSESLKLLSKMTSKNIFINIVGFCVDSISKESVSDIQKLNLPSRIQISKNKISDEELIENLVLSDYYLLPYSRNFRNVSGQLIEAAWRDIPVIASDFEPLSGQVRNWNLGYLFENDNPGSLAELFENIAVGKLKSPVADNNFKNMINPDNIKNQFQNLYNNV